MSWFDSFGFYSCHIVPKNKTFDLACCVFDAIRLDASFKYDKKEDVIAKVSRLFYFIISSLGHYYYYLQLVNWIVFEVNGCISEIEAELVLYPEYLEAQDWVTEKWSTTYFSCFPLNWWKSPKGKKEKFWADKKVIQSESKGLLWNNFLTQKSQFQDVDELVRSLSQLGSMMRASMDQTCAKWNSHVVQE